MLLPKTSPAGTAMRLFPKLRPNGWDGLVAAAVVLLAVVCAAAFWVRGKTAQGELMVVVSIDGEEAERFTPAEERMEKTYTSRGYTLHVLVRDGGVEVQEADCPTQDCVHTGYIDRAGESIVCLPARVIIQLVRTDGGSDLNGVDAVVG